MERVYALRRKSTHNILISLHIVFSELYIRR
jgi:hypothetical protein